MPITRTKPDKYKIITKLDLDIYIFPEKKSTRWRTSEHSHLPLRLCNDDYNSQTKIKEHYKNFSIVQDIMSFSYFCYNSVKMIIPQYNLSDQYI